MSFFRVIVFVTCFGLNLHTKLLTCKIKPMKRECACKYFAYEVEGMAGGECRNKRHSKIGKKDTPIFILVEIEVRTHSTIPVT